MVRKINTNSNNIMMNMRRQRRRRRSNWDQLETIDHIIFGNNTLVETASSTIQTCDACKKQAQNNNIETFSNNLSNNS